MKDFAETIILIFGMVIGIVIWGALIALAISWVKKSRAKAKQEIEQAEAEYNRMLQELPQNKRMLFAMQYNAEKKDSTTAIWLAIILGNAGVHKFYLKQTQMGIVYLLFCWTYIPGIISWLEAFSIPGQVARYNRQKATEIFTMLHDDVKLNMLP